MTRVVIRACQDFLVRGRRSPLGWLQVLRTNIANIDGLIRLVDAMPNDTTELREVAEDRSATCHHCVFLS